MSFLSFFQQKGGIKCSMCGSIGVNKSTCPYNPNTKNPLIDKHSYQPDKKVVKKIVKKITSINLEDVLPKNLNFPNFRNAEKVLNQFISQYAYDEQGDLKKDFPKEWKNLSFYPPWNTFLKDFSKFLEKDKSFNDMVQHYLRDYKSNDIEKAQINVAMQNLDYFSHDLMEYLNQNYGYIFVPISEKQSQIYDNQGDLTLIDYTYKPAKYFVLKQS
jgi:hypothetical protein